MNNGSITREIAAVLLLVLTITGACRLGERWEMRRAEGRTTLSIAFIIHPASQWRAVP